jgi:dinuclear metal center YbgI/SA1388 family protein
MPRVGEILSVLQRWAPPAIAWDRDNIGLLVGSSDAVVARALICLDVTPAVVEEALREGAELIVAHHPVIFHPLRSLRTDSVQGAMLAELLRREINVLALHTNADAARAGLNTALAEALTLKETTPLAAAQGHLRQLTLRIPRDAKTEAAIADLLDGKPDLHWTSHSLDGDRRAFEIELLAWQSSTLRVELARVARQPSHLISETRMEGEVPGFGMGAVGELNAALSAHAFFDMVKEALGCAMLRVSPFDEGKLIRRVAVCSGAGAQHIRDAIAAGADTLVTGDLTHHAFLDHQRDILLVDAGHYDTERLFLPLCARQLENLVFGNNEKIDILCSRTNTNPIWFV